MLSLRNITTSFKTKNGEVKAVNGVNLEVRQGDKIAVVGESGSGKTILGLSLMRLLPQNCVIRGEIFFNGRDILKCDACEMRIIRGNEIGMIFQNPLLSLNPVYTTERQLCEAAIKIKKTNRENARAHARETLELCGFHDPDRILKSYPFQLSGGELTRIMIAMGIIGRPSLLIADEPSKGLDTGLQRYISELLESLCGELGIALIFITHNLKLAHHLCHRIAVMYAGEIVENCPGQNFLSHPVHPYSRALVAALPGNGMKPIAGRSASLIDVPAGCRFYARCEEQVKKCEKEHPAMKERYQDHYARCHADD